ncbi:hypothetical protein V6N13_039082 [Hibiscus sabdariffa]
MRKLRSLDLSLNEIESFGSYSIEDSGKQVMMNLEKLDLSEFESLRKLKFVRLDGGFGDGTVSLLQVVQAFPSVETFFLDNNYLSKTISTQELENVSTNVQEISLYNSHLSHNILQSIGALTSLRRLTLQNSLLTGPLPSKCKLFILTTSTPTFLPFSYH